MRELKLLVKREGQPYGSIYFKYAEELTEEQAMKLQLEYGFHPSGYGFYSYKVEGGSTTWNCSNHCD
tara:strand:- start:433 stop:633 length:201 start_codon:yes stop_codon:yes gene_type:complete